MEAWDELVGGGVEGMTGRKVLGRTEQMQWQPPIVSFVIERHGALVGGGSTRGQLQRWHVNTLTAAAECSQAGHRQLRPAARPVRAAPLVKEISEAIERHDSNNRAVIWLSSNRVRVIPTYLDELQTTVKQTAEGRRKRFIGALDTRLQTLGWTRLPIRGRFVYEQESGVVTNREDL